MSWIATGFSAVMAVDGAMQGYQSGKANAAFNKKQAAYNDKQNLKSSRIQGVQLDTNIVRSRVEAFEASEAVSSQGAEAEALARVQGAAAGNIGGTYDTVINSFARKQNKAQGNIIQELVAGLVGDKLQREQVGIQATNGQSVVNGSSPSAFGTMLGGVGNFFSMTKGVDFGGLFKSSGSGTGYTASEMNNASSYAPNFTNSSTGYSRLSTVNQFTGG